MSEYKHMTDFLKDNQELLEILKRNHAKLSGSKITVIASLNSFQILAELAAAEYRFYAPASIARAWGISRQAVNNVVSRGQIATIEFSSPELEYKYCLFDKIPGLREKRGADWRTEAGLPAAEFEPVESVSPVEIPEELPPVAEIPDGVPGKEDRAPADFPSIEELTKKGFSRDEAKILRAGFNLVRYVREEKKILRVSASGHLWWYADSYSKTYADAERKLAEILKDETVVQVTDAKIVESGRSQKLLERAGFEFYRKEGEVKGCGTIRIKVRSKNWGTLENYRTIPGLRAAWVKLMKDDKALEG